MTGVICGTGSCVPGRTLDNHDIAELVDTSDEWIRERTGIVRRRVIEDETTVTMAAEAGARALKDAGMAPEELDLIVVATFSSNVALPCTACEVQRILGAVNAVCFDLNAACSGFIFAYNTAVGHLLGGMCRTALIIGSESLSTLTNWKDRGTCILFGDGAGAAVLRARDGIPYRAVAHSDGGKGSALICRTGNVKNRKEQAAEDLYMQMDGRSVFQFAVKKVPEAIHEVLEANGLKVEDIDYFILHQANQRIVEAVARRMGIEIGKFPMNLQEYGNTSSASIPILLDELRRNGTLRPGQKLVIAGFGAGLSWGADIIDWEI